MQIRAIIFAGKSRQLLDEFTSTWCVLHYTMNKTHADCDDASVCHSLSWRFSYIAVFYSFLKLQQSLMSYLDVSELLGPNLSSSDQCCLIGQYCIRSKLVFTQVNTTQPGRWSLLPGYKARVATQAVSTLQQQTTENKFFCPKGHVFLWLYCSLCQISPQQKSLPV